MRGSDERRDGAQTLRRRVYEALHCAAENDTDWKQFDRHIKGRVYAIAQDLGTCCPDLEGIEPETLMPYVAAWLDEIPMKIATLAICGAPCEHDFQGWREFSDGNGGEQVCTKCGMGAMAHSLRTGP